MARIVQICPISLESDRVMFGIREHPANVIYLLKSFEETKANRQIAKIAGDIVEKLEKRLNYAGTAEIFIRKTSMNKFEKVIEDLCIIIKDELEVYNAEKIWINTSTANKLIVSVAMYVSSFKPDKVKLFYIRALDFTIADILNDELKKEDIKNKFINSGVTYERDRNSYQNIDLPTYPTQILSDTAKSILITLKQLGSKKNEGWVKFMDVIKEFNEDATNKSVKMKYSHHFKPLVKKNLLDERFGSGRKKEYKLTKEGNILGIIFNYFK